MPYNLVTCSAARVWNTCRSQDISLPREVLKQESHTKSIGICDSSAELFEDQVQVDCNAAI